MLLAIEAEPHVAQALAGRLGRLGRLPWVIPGRKHALEARVLRHRIILVHLEREGRRLERAATALHDRQRCQEIADHALAHLERHLLTIDLTATLEIADAVAVHDDAPERQFWARHVGAARATPQRKR